MKAVLLITLRYRNSIRGSEAVHGQFCEEFRKAYLCKTVALHLALERDDYKPAFIIKRFKSFMDGIFGLWNANSESRQWARSPEP